MAGSSIIAVTIRLDLAAFENGLKQHHCCDKLTPAPLLWSLLDRQEVLLVGCEWIKRTAPLTRSHHRPLFVYIRVFPLRCRKRACVCVNITREPKSEPLPPSPNPKALSVFFHIHLGLNPSTRISPQKSRTSRVWNKRSPTTTHYSADSGYHSATCFNNELIQVMNRQPVSTTSWSNIYIYIYIWIGNLSQQWGDPSYCLVPWQLFMWLLPDAAGPWAQVAQGLGPGPNLIKNKATWSRMFNQII